jgi:hypothetical protein
MVVLATGLAAAVVAVVLATGDHAAPRPARTPRTQVAQAPAASPVPAKLAPGAASVTVGDQGARLAPQTARRSGGYVMILLRNLTDGRRFVRVGRASVETTSVGLLPHSQLYNRVPLAPGRYRVSVRRAGEAFGDIGFLSVR